MRDEHELFHVEQSPPQFVTAYVANWRKSHPESSPRWLISPRNVYRIVTVGLVALLIFFALSASGCSGERTFVQTGESEGLFCSRPATGGAMVCVPAKNLTE